MSPAGRGIERTLPAWLTDAERRGPAAPAPAPAERQVQAERASDEWQRAVSPDGRPYWIHSSTQRTSWTVPGATAQSSDNASVEVSSSRQQQEEWKEVKTAEGKTYFYNTVTRETSWTRPTARTRKQDEDVTPLPDGWRAYTDSRGKEYFVHAESGKTQWERPADGERQGVEEQYGESLKRGLDENICNGDTNEQLTKKRALNDKGSDVAASWQQLVTAEGQVYYMNTETRETAWTLPAEAATQDSSAATSSSDSEQEMNQRAADVRLRKTGGQKGDPVRLSIPSKLVQRPRSPSGRPLTDREAERAFLYKFWARSRRNQMKDNFQPIAVPRAEVDAHSREAFMKLLMEAGVSSQTPWLTVMKICSQNPLYTSLLPSYGERKDAYHALCAKLSKQERISASLAKRSARECFVRMLREHLSEQSFDLRKKLRDLGDCHAQIRSAVLSDARNGLVSEEEERAQFIRLVLYDLEHESREEQREKRRANMRSLRAFLEASDECDAKAFKEGVSFREVHDLCLKMPEFAALDERDRLIVFEDWSRERVRRLARRRAEEQERVREQKQSSKREFRRELVRLVASGVIKVSKTWSFSKGIIAEEPWVKNAEACGWKAEALFDEELDELDRQVCLHMDAIKQVVGKNLQVDWSMEEFDVDMVASHTSVAEYFSKNHLDEVTGQAILYAVHGKVRRAVKKSEKAWETKASKFRSFVQEHMTGAGLDWSALQDLLALSPEMNDVASSLGDQVCRKMLMDCAAISDFRKANADAGTAVTVVATDDRLLQLHARREQILQRLAELDSESAQGEVAALHIPSNTSDKGAGRTGVGENAANSLSNSLTSDGQV
ncbi:Pre-mRNA-processing protein 40A [Porphyridium purpureum]|uniref:Pre-mRNA-processing protein 40A n=1 Tax=Porphyridium purpureum TaxID=35688 RepID=A0A5J4YKH0_PORPP|nr:Pre-mRNA-processing protein 40A [Porphyridium purpureum]|eukprot:POR4926..scf244_11